MCMIGEFPAVWNTRRNHCSLVECGNVRSNGSSSLIAFHWWNVRIPLRLVRSTFQCSINGPKSPHDFPRASGRRHTPQGHWSDRYSEMELVRIQANIFPHSSPLHPCENARRWVSWTLSLSLRKWTILDQMIDIDSMNPRFWIKHVPLAFINWRDWLPSSNALTIHHRLLLRHQGNLGDRELVLSMKISNDLNSTWIDFQCLECGSVPLWVVKRVK